MNAVINFPFPWRKTVHAPEPIVPPCGRLMDLNAIKPGFVFGPYTKRNGERPLYAEVDGELVLVGMTFTNVSTKVSQEESEATAHLFKASTDLFDVTLAAARLADLAYRLNEHELRERIAALLDPAEVALARATGLLG